MSPTLRIVTVTLIATLVTKFSNNVDAFGNRFSARAPSSSSMTGRVCILSKATSRDLHDDVSPEVKKRKRDKVMDFLRKKGVIGRNKDFTNAMGVDEGPIGKSGGMKRVKKSADAYKSCTETGIIDDMSESFPMSSSGTEWSGFTDRVMGGVSMGTLVREQVDGRMSNLMTGSVSLANNGGFIQMATPLSKDPLQPYVDASDFDGIEIDILYKGDNEEESFNVHLRNSACARAFSYYKGTFDVSPNKWQTVRLSWSDFEGYGPGSNVTPFSPTDIRRLGIVASGKPMKVYVAVSGVRFYSVI